LPLLMSAWLTKTVLRKTLKTCWRRNS
jgi:hypothetical protein